MKNKIFTANAVAAIALCAALSSAGADLYMAGDSIMTTYNETQVPQYGWGQALGTWFMKDPAKLHNLARAGWSARRFRESGRWETYISSQLAAGDWVIVSFAHNDSNGTREADYSTPDQYKGFLTGFVQDAREKGANIAFATSIPMSSGFRLAADGTMSVEGGYGGIGQYIAAMRELAAELNVPVLDLNAYAEAHLPELGFRKARSLYMLIKPGLYANKPDGQIDYAHIRDAGAFFYARAAVEMAREQGLSLADLWIDPATAAFERVVEPASDDESRWICESSWLKNWTGTWPDDVAWDAEGGLYLHGSRSFVPYEAPTGNVAVVETKMTFSPAASGADPDQDAHVALRLSAAGVFQAWARSGANAGWNDVAADGLSPVGGAEYTVRATVNYGAGEYSLEVLDGETWKALAAVDGGATAFRLARNASRASEIAFKGETVLKSLSGTCAFVAVEGFNAGDVAGAAADIVLDAARAAWLNRLGDYGTVSNYVSRMAAADFDKAYLCNLDLTQAGADAQFAITGIAVEGDCVAVSATLTRTNPVRSGGVAEPINGVLRFYGAATLEEFRTRSVPVEATVPFDDDFSDGDTSVVRFEKGGDAFFSARIE